jgi:hypothetical protein
LFLVSSFPDLKLLYGLPILQSKFDHFLLQGGKAEQESLQVLHIPFFVLIILAMALICFKRSDYFSHGFDLLQEEEHFEEQKR